MANSIMSAEEHQNALVRLEELWEAKPGTPEGDEFVQLSERIEEYEDVHFPMGHQREQVNKTVEKQPSEAAA